MKEFKSKMNILWLCNPYETKARYSLSRIWSLKCLLLNEGIQIENSPVSESLKCLLLNRDVTINREPVENRFKYVMIQISWDAKQIAIQLGVGVYECMSEGNLLSLEKFRCYLEKFRWSFHLASV